MLRVHGLLMWSLMLCSTWVMLNTLTRRLAKMPDEMRSKMEYLAPHPPRWVQEHLCHGPFTKPACYAQIVMDAGGHHQSLCPCRDSLPASEIRKKIPDIVLPPEVRPITA